ncbi:MAG: GAF domain-containing protein [Anaerolineales bacterium]
MMPSDSTKPDSRETSSFPVTDTLLTIRLRILNNVSVVAAIVGVLSYFLVVIRSIEETPPAAAAVYTVVVIWMIIVALMRRMKFEVRAVSLTVLVYLLSVTSYIQSGVTTDGAVFMVGFIFMAAILLGGRGSVYALGIGVVTVAGLAVAMSRHIIVPTQIFAYDYLSAWINRIVVILLLGTVISASLATMLRGLQDNLQKTLQFATLMEQDRARLREHSANLERRSRQIRTAAEISRSITGVLNPQALLQEVVDLIKERFGLYYAGVFLVDEQKRFAVLRAGTGEEGQAMIQAGHKLPIGESSMVGWTILNRQARIALDVGKDAVRFANPYLPNTHSELALPLISGERVLGALTIQSELPEAFDEDDIIILQNISDTLAIALENARLFTELESNLEEIRRLHGQYLQEVWSQRSGGPQEAEFRLSADETEELTPVEIPLTLREQIIGQLMLEGRSEWTPEERALIESIATQAALALENARLLEESQQMALQERLIAEITSKIWSSPNTDLILQTAVKELGRALRADEATVELKLD